MNDGGIPSSFSTNCVKREERAGFQVKIVFLFSKLKMFNFCGVKGVSTGGCSVHAFKMQICLKKTHSTKTVWK